MIETLKSGLHASGKTCLIKPSLIAGTIRFAYVRNMLRDHPKRGNYGSAWNHLGSNARSGGTF